MKIKPEKKKTSGLRGLEPITSAIPVHLKKKKTRDLDNL